MTRQKSFAVKKIQIQFQITLSKPPELIGVILYPHSYFVYSISPLPSPLEIVACHVLNPVTGLTHPLFLVSCQGLFQIITTTKLVLRSYCYCLNESDTSVRTYAIIIAIAIETLPLTTAPM